MQGSWFGDWNLTTNNFLRSCLATTNYGLAAVWYGALNVKWRFETLGLGETLGDGWLRSVNDTNQFPNGGKRWMALMGDPTLRLHVSAPPSNLVASTNGGNVVLTWTISPESNAYYYIYRSTNGLTGPFTRLTSNPIISANYTDASPPAGQKMYQVRALGLTVTGSGSYTNLSQGIFVTTN